jgi:hypothetical protein
MRLLFLMLTLSHLATAQDSLKTPKRVRLTPLPVVYYSPETRLGFGGLLAANFETSKVPDTITLTSYSQLYFLYTVNKQYDFGGITRIYAPQNKFIFQGKANYTYFPEYYFGVETEDPDASKDTIEYNRIFADFRFYWQVRKSYYLGFATRFNKISNLNGNEGHFIEEKPLGYDNYWIQGFAPALNIETRDSYVYPRKGSFLEVLYYVYPSWSGKSYAFRSLKLDARKYFPVEWISKIDALAFQFIATINAGNVPFKDMADIGGSSTMRGYYTGYYRYNNLYAFQAEYRANVWKRLGFTVWLGAALTPQKWYTFTDNSVKPNAGIGLRVMFNRNDKLNVRVDQGFGKKGQDGFYLDIAEAF